MASLILIENGSYNDTMGLLPDTQNCGLRRRRECRERFPRHRLQRKPLVSDPGMHHGTCVTHVPWCMSGSLTRGGGENVPGIPGAWCATRNFTYLVRGSLPEPILIYHKLVRSRGSHYSDVIMSAMASQITGVSIVCSAVCSGADQRKYQSSASLAFVNIFRVTGPLWGESTGHRWIPLTKGQ